MNKETILQNQIMVAMSELGCIPYRMHVGVFYSKNAVPVRIGLEGTPDLMIITPDGGVLWYEIKTETGKLRDKQKEFTSTLKSMNHKVYTIRSVEQAKKVFQNGA